MECIICFEQLDCNVNCITTTCGHSFHGNCFLTHTSYNGYNCPCCRKSLVENKPESEDSDEDLDSYDDETALEENAYDEDESFYSFRWFCQRINNEELEQDEGRYAYYSNLMSSNMDPEIETEVILAENKEQVDKLINKVKSINKLPYDKLLAAFISLSCNDFRYNDYAADMNYEVQRLVEDVHERMQRG